MSDYDMHCPQMGHGLNYWKVKCEARQKNPNLHRTCYPECQDKKLKQAQTTGKKTGDISNGNVKKVIDLVNSGMRVMDISEKLGLPRSTVSRYKHMAKNNGLIKTC